MHTQLPSMTTSYGVVAFRKADYVNAAGRLAAEAVERARTPRPWRSPSSALRARCRSLRP